MAVEIQDQYSLRVGTMSRVSTTKNHPRQPEPRTGSCLRALWDLLQTNKGEWIEVPEDIRNRISTTGNLANLRQQLTDFYGLDIITRQPPTRTRVGRGGECHEWRLIGEWFGKVYLDYTRKVP